MSAFHCNKSNPYGVQPTGNAFLVTNPKVLGTRPNGLGNMRLVNDEALLEVLSFLDAVELASVGMCSRILYVLSLANDLWRDLTLRVSDNNLSFSYSWRDTYVKRELMSRGTVALTESMWRHTPIKVEGAFSNILHRAWSCRNGDLAAACPGFWSTSTVERVPAASLTVEQFVERFEVPNMPVVIEDSSHHWPAARKWTREYLTTACGDAKFRATSGTASSAASFTLAEYFAYSDQAQEEVPLYLFDSKFLESAPALLEDYSVPPYFNGSAAHGTDLFRLLGHRKRPDYRWLIAGPARSGSVFHIDPNMTNAWNISLTGRKKWIFYPPGVSPPGVVASEDGADVTVPLSTGEWLLSFWKEHLDARKYWPEHARPLETIANAGDLVFVPHGYWHMVVNLDDCIALTQNYVSSSNLHTVLHFLRDKPDQISGIRDRADKDIVPEQLHEELVQAIAASNAVSEDSLRRSIARSEVLREEYVRSMVSRASHPPALQFNQMQRKKKLMSQRRSSNGKRRATAAAAVCGNASVGGTATGAGSSDSDEDGHPKKLKAMPEPIDQANQEPCASFSFQFSF